MGIKSRQRRRQQAAGRASAGAGSGFIAIAASGVSAARPTRVTFGSDGVIYDPDQFDPDANVRSGGVLFTQTADPVGASSSPAHRH